MTRWEWFLTGIPILILGGVLGYFVITKWTAPGQLPPAQEVQTLPHYAEIDPFSFVDQDGRVFTEKDLAGKIWVAQFFFASCPGPCPAVSRQMGQLQQMAAGVQSLRLVSISIDPEHDTPAVLKEYATRMGAQPGRWFFLTGPPAALAKLVRQNFMIGFQENPKEVQASQGRFLHSTKLALVDGDGSVRGYYDGLDMETPQRILSDIGLLMQEEGLQ